MNHTFETQPMLLLLPTSLERQWYASLAAAIYEAVYPLELPPLQITSKPVPVRILKMYAGNVPAAGAGSVLIHVGALALLFFLGSLHGVQRVLREQVTFIAPNLSGYLAPKPDASHGGGGGGVKAPLDASTGKLPKMAARQFVPPETEPLQHPELPLAATLVVAPDLTTAVAIYDGDPLSRLAAASNGIGAAGGIGDGRGGGVGPGFGGSAGTGSRGGFSNGAYLAGGGVSAPTVLFKMEPEYSEEARKAKWQGTVVLSVVVDASGRPRNLRVLRSLGLGLDEKAMEAVAKWKFKPGLKDGKPVPVQATIEVSFRLL